MTDKTNLLCFILLLGLMSCSHEKTAPVSEKTYSESTEREFEAIEKGDGTRSTKKRIPPAHDLKRIPPVAASKTSVKPLPEQTKVTVDGPLTARAQERLQEINQNLAFYCMKHRSTFSNEEKCLQFTKKILKSCEYKHKLINTVMVNCIKDQLKRRR